ncbi:MAG: hypothetical protein IJ252_07820 [Solobacterium sp.]|nr:hypothetical protein [Solobacterium sp.]
MKIIMIILLSLFLGGCKSENSLNEADYLDPADQNSYENYPVYTYEGGLFWLRNNSELMYIEGADHPVFVSDINFNDDIPESEKPVAEKYSEAITGSGIYVYGDNIIYISRYTNAEGAASFRMMAMAIDGSKRQEIMNFDYEPLSFIIQDNLILTSEQCTDLTCAIHVYDIKGSELKKISGSWMPYHFFADGMNIYYCEMSYDTEKVSVMKMDLHDFSVTELLKNEVFVYEKNQLISVYSLSSPYSPELDPYSVITTSKLVDTESDETVFVVTDQIINYFDDKYIYCSSIKEEHAIYSIYDFDGHLIKEIIPGEQIDIGRYYPGLFATDCSQIIRIIDKDIISMTTDKETGREIIISCDTDTGKCRVIAE